MDLEFLSKEEIIKILATKIDTIIKTGRIEDPKEISCKRCGGWNECRNIGCENKETPEMRIIELAGKLAKLILS